MPLSSAQHTAQNTTAFSLRLRGLILHHTQRAAIPLLSPYEVHIALLAAGPGFKKGYIDTLPTSNVDIVPTVLHMLHIPVPAGMSGRVLTELLTDGTNPGNARVEITKSSASFGKGIYKLELQRTVLGKYQYVDFARIVRVEDTKSALLRTDAKNVDKPTSPGIQPLQ